MVFRWKFVEFPAGFRGIPLAFHICANAFELGCQPLLRYFIHIPFLVFCTASALVKCKICVVVAARREKSIIKANTFLRPFISPSVFAQLRSGFCRSPLVPYSNASASPASAGDALGLRVD